MVTLWAPNPSFAIGACGYGRSGATGQGRWGSGNGETMMENNGFFYNQESWDWKGFIGIWGFLKMVDPPKSHWFTKMV